MASRPPEIPPAIRASPARKARRRLLSRSDAYSCDLPLPGKPVRIADGTSRMGAEIKTTDPKPADLAGRYFYRASVKGNDGYFALTAGNRNPSARRSRRDLEGDRACPGDPGADGELAHRQRLREARRLQPRSGGGAGGRARNRPAVARFPDEPMKAPP